MCYKFNIELKLENELLKILLPDQFTNKNKHILILLKNWSRNPMKRRHSNLIINCLNRLNQIHRQIEKNNVFWSKYLFCTSFMMGGISSVIIAQSISDPNTITKIFATLIFVATSSHIILLFVFAIRVHNESINSFPILYELCHNLRANVLPIGVKLKVNFNK